MHGGASVIVRTALAIIDCELERQDRCCWNKQRWVHSKCITDIGLILCCAQVESLDAEIESMAGPKKKAKPQPKLVHLEEATSRHKQHITRLEQVLTGYYCEPSMPLISPPFPALCSS